MDFTEMSTQRKTFPGKHALSLLSHSVATTKTAQNQYVEGLEA
jgi:hypothetical protein